MSKRHREVEFGSGTCAIAATTRARRRDASSSHAQWVVATMASQRDREVVVCGPAGYDQLPERWVWSAPGLEAQRPAVVLGTMHRYPKEVR